MADEFDPWKTSSGLKDDYDGLVTDAYFAQDVQYNRMQLHLTVLAEDGDEVDLRYNTGAEWQTFDGGATVEHPKAKWFNTNSAMGKLVTAGIGAAEDVLRKRTAEYGGLGPKAAGIWKGLRFHWEVDSSSGTMTDPETGKERSFTSNVTVPTAYLGEGESENVIKPAVDNSVLNGLGEDTKSKMAGLAGQMGYQDWIDAVMDLPGVGDSPNIASKLNEALYVSLKG